MSATVHLSAHSWASAHRVLLTVVAIALALAAALTITFVVSRTPADETPAPGFPTERCFANLCAK